MPRECDHCGPLLRQAKDDFADDLTPEEANTVVALPSAGADWQSRLAAITDSCAGKHQPQPAENTAAHRNTFSWKLAVSPLPPSHSSPSL